MTFIITLILIFIIWPVVKAAWHIYRLQNQAKQMFSQAANSQQSAHRRATQQRKAGWSTPVNRKEKKIGRDVGEYVAYETIAASETTSTEDSATSGNQAYGTSTESRISDADWEEI